MRYECELVLRENGDEKRQPYMLADEVRPGMFVRTDGRDWVVIETQEGRPPSTVDLRTSTRRRVVAGPSAPRFSRASLDSARAGTLL
jgi:hypothetical protein